MNTKNDGGPAFPCDTIVLRDEKGRLQGCEISSTGLTLRDHFAGLALQGMLASPVEGPALDCNEDFAEHYANLSYIYAGAMLKAREAI